MDRAELAADAVQTLAVQTLAVQVVYCPATGITDLVRVNLADGSTLVDAVLASGFVAAHGLVVTDLRLGVWGKPRDAQSLLRERDRVEIYRPLTVDPKEARRLRYKKHRLAQVAASAPTKEPSSTAI